MDRSRRIRLNTLNYDRDREIVSFSFAGMIGDHPATISGEVPINVVDSTNVRDIAKAAVLQALTEAANTLEDRPTSWTALMPRCRIWGLQA